MTGTDITPDPVIAPTVNEVQGVFPSDAALEDAVARLTQAGFDHADLSLPQTAPPASQATPELGAAPVNTGTDMRQTRTLGTSMAGAVGLMTAAGLAAVATGGALAAAAAAGVAGGVGAGAVAGAAGKAAMANHHDAREQAAREGTLVLAVRLASPDRQARAEQAMKAAGATKVAAVTRTTAAVDSAAWTG